MKYKVCCPFCENEKCVKGTDKCEAELWAKDMMKKREQGMGKQYLRFGDIPKDKISRIHRSDAILGEEKGVSVWDCAFVNDVPFPLLPDNASEDCMADYFYHLFGNKPVYLVEGTELKERGSANEPLLGKDIKIVSEYTEVYKYLKRIHTR